MSEEAGFVIYFPDFGENESAHRWVVHPLTRPGSELMTVLVHLEASSNLNLATLLNFGSWNYDRKNCTGCHKIRYWFLTIGKAIQTENFEILTSLGR